jgi:hypothetical protein
MQYLLIEKLSSGNTYHYGFESEKSKDELYKDLILASNQKGLFFGIRVPMALRDFKIMELQEFFENVVIKDFR